MHFDFEMTVFDVWVICTNIKKLGEIDNIAAFINLKKNGFFNDFLSFILKKDYIFEFTCLVIEETVLLKLQSINLRSRFLV